MSELIQSTTEALDERGDHPATEDDAPLRTWEVTVPIAGHAFLTVEAATEEEAIDIALNEASFDNIEEWSAIRQFHEGNVCYCPHPWEAEATDATPGED